MRKILTMIFAFATFFAMKAEDIKSPVMEGAIDGKEAVMQIVFHPEIDQDMESSVQGWFYYKSEGEKNKYELSGYYDGGFTDAEITFFVGKNIGGAITDEGEMNGVYTAGHMSGIGETGTFEGTFKSHNGKSYEFSFSNM